MESRYGIGINNRYALFLDSEDGEDLILPKKKSSVDNTKSPATTTTPTAPVENKPVKKAEPVDNKKDKTSAPASNVNQNNRVTKDPAKAIPNREDKENRNNRFEAGKRPNPDTRKPQEGPRESREERNNRRNKPPGENPGAPAGPDGDGAKRGGGRGGGMRGGAGRGGRGGPGGRGGGRGKRDFDRKSGDDKTGVKAVDKKEGSGSHNWGTFEDEMKAEEDKANISADLNESPAENETPAADATNEAADAEAAAKKAAEEEEAKTMTLDEWKAQQGKKDLPKFNLRKAGEGSDLDPKWKKTYAYKKEKETQDDEDEEEHEVYMQRANRQKKILDIEFSFNDPTGPAGSDRGRGGRGGRGGGRGRDRDRGERGDGAPRGGDRGNRRGGRGGGSGFKPRGGKGTEAPNVNDEMSFPSLG